MSVKCNIATFLTNLEDKTISLEDLRNINQMLFYESSEHFIVTSFKSSLNIGPLSYGAPIQSDSKQPTYELTVKTKHFTSPYIYVNDNQVYLMVPVANVGNIQIALDNTCRGLLAYKDWQANCVEHLKRAKKYYVSLYNQHHSIIEQIDYYINLLSDFLQGDFLTSSGKEKRDNYGFYLPSSIVNILAYEQVNYVNLWLTPDADWDNCCPFPISVPSIFRMRDSSAIGFPHKLIELLKHYSNEDGIIELPRLFAENIYLNKSIIMQIIDIYLVKSKNIPIKNQSDFEQLLRLIKEQIPSFNVDPNVNLISWCRSTLMLPETAPEKEVLAALKQAIDSETQPGGEYTYIRDDIENIIHYLAKNRTDVITLPSPLSGEIDIKRLSIRIQLWLGMLSVFAYQQTGEKFDLGEYINKDNELSSMLIGYLVSFFEPDHAPKKVMEDYLVDCLKLHIGLPSSFIAALYRIDLQEAKRIFAEAVFTTDQSQHYDNFQVYFDGFIDCNGVYQHKLLGPFYKFLGHVSLPLKTFFEQFVTEDVLVSKQGIFHDCLNKLKSTKLLEQISMQNNLECTFFMQKINVANLEVSVLAEILMTKMQEGQYICETLEDDCITAIENREDFNNLYLEIAAYAPKMLAAFSEKFKSNIHDMEHNYSYYSLSSEQVLAIQFSLGGQYYFLHNYDSSTLDRIDQFFNHIPGLNIIKNKQQLGSYILQVPIDQTTALSKQLSYLRTSLHLTPSIAATLYCAVELAGKGAEINDQNNQQLDDDYKQTKIYKALKALGLSIDTMLSLEYSAMNGYVLKLKKYSPLVSEILRTYQKIISINNIIARVISKEELLSLCNYLGINNQHVIISKDEFLKQLKQKFNLANPFAIAEVVGISGNFSIEISETTLHLWCEESTGHKKIAKEDLLLCMPEISMEIICNYLITNDESNNYKSKNKSKLQMN